MNSEMVNKLLDAYEKAFSNGEMYVAQLYLEAAKREMNND